MGEHHVLSLFFLSFGLRASLAERPVGWVFFSLSIVMGGTTMGRHGHIFFEKIDHRLGGGGGRLRFIGKSRVTNFEISTTHG